MRSLLNGGIHESTFPSIKDDYSAQIKELQQKIEGLSAEIALFKGGGNL
jgi:hypothetical protein